MVYVLKMTYTRDTENKLLIIVINFDITLKVVVIFSFVSVYRYPSYNTY